MSYDPSKVAFVDTETTGLDPEWHKVWEIAVIVDGVEHCWQQRSNGGTQWQDGRALPMSIDPWVRENTRILADYDHDTALPWKDSIERFRDLVAGRHLVGACPWFDSERLHRAHIAAVSQDDRGHYLPVKAEVRQHPWHYHLIDVETLAIGWIARAQADLRGRGVQATIIPDLPWDSRVLSVAVGVDPADFQPAHTALTDARWAKAIFERIMNNG